MRDPAHGRQQCIDFDIYYISIFLKTIGSMPEQETVVSKVSHGEIYGR